MSRTDTFIFAAIDLVFTSAMARSGNSSGPATPSSSVVSRRRAAPKAAAAPSGGSAPCEAGKRGGRFL